MYIGYLFAKVLLQLSEIWSLSNCWPDLQAVCGEPFSRETLVDKRSPIKVLRDSKFMNQL